MKIKQFIVRVLDKMPYIRGIKRDLVNYEKWGIPGHFYNPIPNIDEVIQFEYEVERKDEYAGINLCDEEQWKFIDACKKLYSEIPFPHNKTDLYLYHFQNPNYSYADGIFYYFILRNFSPKKIIEIGSGYSTCLAIDVNKIYFQNNIEIYAVEPYPDLVIQLTGSDAPTLINKKIQEVDLLTFDQLDENDILFIDSSHVLKAGSDLNYIFFKIIPRLKKGVLIHFHDIFDKFKYPLNWITEYYRGWNEVYALKLFLMYNEHFKVIAFNNYLIKNNEKWFKEHMPLCLENPGGSIWLRKIT
jgi:hypothetical protein